MNVYSCTRNILEPGDWHLFSASYSLPSHALSRGIADTLNDIWT